MDQSRVLYPALEWQCLRTTLTRRGFQLFAEICRLDSAMAQGVNPAAAQLEQG